jgi:hypothetical protein
MAPARRKRRAPGSPGVRSDGPDPRDAEGCGSCTAPRSSTARLRRSERGGLRCGRSGPRPLGGVPALYLLTWAAAPSSSPTAWPELVGRCVADAGPPLRGSGDRTGHPAHWGEGSLEHVVLGRDRPSSWARCSSTGAREPASELASRERLRGPAGRRPPSDPQTLETSVPGIYAAGDIVGRPYLAISAAATGSARLCPSTDRYCRTTSSCDRGRPGKLAAGVGVRVPLSPCDAIHATPTTWPPISHDGLFWDAYLELEDSQGLPGPGTHRLLGRGTTREPVRTATIFLEDTPQAVLARARDFKTHQLVALLRSCAPEPRRAAGGPEGRRHARCSPRRPAMPGAMPGRPGRRRGRGTGGNWACWCPGRSRCISGAPAPGSRPSAGSSGRRSGRRGRCWRPHPPGRARTRPLAPVERHHLHEAHRADRAADGRVEPRVLHEQHGQQQSGSSPTALLSRTSATATRSASSGVAP